MRVRVEERGDLVVAALEGELDKLTRDAVLAQLEPAEGVHELVLDLSGVTFVDSAGLHALFGLVQAANTRGGGVRVVVPPDSPIRRVLEIAHLGSVVPVVDALVDDVLGADATGAPPAA
jgi:anti-anti-sigma factor